jgi:phospholipid-binding lipoprotein MlaA
MRGLSVLLSVSFAALALVCSPVLPGLQDGQALAQITDAFTSEEGQPITVYDPYENFNRAMFNFNDKLYFYAVKPAAVVYKAYFMPEFRTAIRNGFDNMLFPVRFINCLLQGKGDKAGTETLRFLINSTMGMGGLYDFAETGFGIHAQEEDFGQTLAGWGVGSGAYLVLPILGPTSSRDFGGYLVDSAMDPLYWIPAELWVPAAVMTGKVVNNTSLRIGQYEDFKRAALDPYISMRSAYYQYRARQIAN